MYIYNRFGDPSILRHTQTVSQLNTEVSPVHKKKIQPMGTL